MNKTALRTVWEKGLVTPEFQHHYLTVYPRTFEEYLEALRIYRKDRATLIISQDLFPRRNRMSPAIRILYGSESLGIMSPYYIFRQELHWIRTIQGDVSEAMKRENIYPKLELITKRINEKGLYLDITVEC